MENPKLAFYLLAVTLMVLSYAVLWRIVNSRLGHLCRSLQQNEELAASIGVNTAYLRVLAYAISSFFGGLAGAVFVAISQSIYPSSFAVTDSVNFMLYCFVGGLGYVSGPMLGTFLLYFGWDLLSVAKEYQLLIYSSADDRHDAGPAQWSPQPSGPERRQQMSPILQIKGVTKRYGGLTANNNISFDVQRGRDPVGDRARTARANRRCSS